MTFKKGDLIIGNEKNIYNITGPGIKCKVLLTRTDPNFETIQDSDNSAPKTTENILVQIIQKSTCPNNTYFVNEKHFERMEKTPNEKIKEKLYGETK